MHPQLVVAAIALVVCTASRLHDVDTHKPQYHFVPSPMGWMNDPNGPFYDPVHKRYHLMFQYLTPRTWGHAVSTDLVHWTNLPIALNTDEWYDKGGVFSGSATVMSDGTPVLSYSVSTNNMQALAFPKNRSDPNLVEWVKPSYNPIITYKRGAPDGRDDTTMWRSQDGKSWLMGYGTSPCPSCGAIVVFQSQNLQNWTQLDYLFRSNVTGMWECPDFYPVPHASSMVTHVAKASEGGKDHWTTGTYDPDSVKFVPVKGTAMGVSTQYYDYGSYYASKRFHDPVLNRQVLFGWVTEERPSAPGGCAKQGSCWFGVQSLPRSVELNDDGVTLSFAPIKELQSLRVASTHKSWTNIIVAANSTVTLTGLTGMQVEVLASVSWPANQSSDCGLRVLSAPSFVEYTDAGVQGGLPVSAVMQHTDLPGMDYNVSKVSYTDYRICQAACEGDPRCKAWTFLLGKCCLKDSVPTPVARSTCTSGAKHATQSNAQVYTDATHSSLNTKNARRRHQGPVLGVSASTDLHIFVDHSVVETYAHGHSAVVTGRAYPTLSTATSLLLYSKSSTPCTFSSVDGWQLEAQ